MNYCLPIIKKTKQEVLDTIAANQHDYRYIEVWLDYIHDVDVPFVEALCKNLGNSLVVVFRRQKLEQPVMPSELRRSLLQLLHNTDIFVDLDVLAQKDTADEIQAHNLKLNLLLSYHNYELTPDSSRLREIVNMMQTYSPAIYKIATFCNSEKDALRLLELLLQLKEEERRFIVLGMGEHGIITRIFGTLWGNEMTFAPQTQREASAPGQLTRLQLEKIMTELQ